MGPAARGCGSAVGSAELAQAPVDLGLDVERLLAARDAARVAGLDQRPHLLAQLGVGLASVSALSSASTSSGASPRAARRRLRASSIWRISASRSAGVAWRSSDIRPPPIWSYEPPLVTSAHTAATAATPTTTNSTIANALSIAPHCRSRPFGRFVLAAPDEGEYPLTSC